MTHAAGVGEDQRQRWIATPSPDVTQLVLKHRHNELTMRRYFAKVDFGFSADDCHIWLGALSDEGYGDFSIKHRTIRAHRVGYLWRFGEIPEETPLLDHVNCLGRFCVNPGHLEPVTNRENTRRGQGVGAATQRVLRSMELVMRDERRAAGEDEIF